MLALAALLLAAPVPKPSAPPGPPMPPLDAKEWRPLGDGVSVWDVRVGPGDKVQEVDWCRLRYTAWLADTGRVALTNVDDKDVPELTLAKQIPGWRRGLLGMGIGGVRRLKLEADQAYGAKGLPPQIPPNARLVFEIELVFTDGP